MKFGVFKKDILKPLEKLSRLVPRRTTLPILHCVKVDFSGSGMSLTAGSIETSMTIEAPASPIDGNTGSFCVDMKQLFGIIKKMPDVGIQFIVEGNMLTVFFGTGKMKLPLMPAEEYPSPQEVSGNKLPIDSSIISKVDKAFRFTDDSLLRPALCGVFFDTAKGNIVGASGYSLYMSSGLPTNSGVESFILTKEAYEGIKELDVHSIMVGDNHALIEGDNFHITARLIDENFPNYESVIPKNEIEYIADLEGLKASIDRSMICSDKETSLVVLEFNNGIHVKTKSKDSGTSFKEKVDCNGDHVDEVGLNGLFMLSSLNSIDTKEVMITFNSKTRPLTIHPMGSENSEKELILLMPMMI